MKKETLIRSAAYLLIILAGLGIIRQKQSVITKKRQEKKISVISERVEKGMPVEVMVMKAEPFSLLSKITVKNSGENKYESYVSRETRDLFKEGMDVYSDIRGNLHFGTVVLVDEEIDYDRGLYRIVVRKDPQAAGNGKDIVYVEYKIIENALSVPSSCIELEGERPFVWIVEEGRAQKQFVQGDNVNFDSLSVDKGLKEGDVVVSNGQTLLKAGMLVRVIAGGEKW